jgi:hypothetical protein
MPSTFWLSLMKASSYVCWHSLGLAGAQEERGTTGIGDSGDSLKPKMCDTKFFKACEELTNS